MKHLHLRLFIMVATYTTSIFASSSINLNDKFDPRACYNSYLTTTNDAAIHCERIKNIIDIPEHLHTTQIKELRTLVIAMHNQISTAKDEYAKYDILFSDLFQQDAKEHYVQYSSHIKDDHEYKAYRQAWLKRSYTETNLVELEQLRIQKEEKARIQSDAAQAGCHCTIS